jgi:hypothetical protein
MYFIFPVAMVVRIPNYSHYQSGLFPVKKVGDPHALPRAPEAGPKAAKLAVPRFLGGTSAGNPWIFHDFPVKYSIIPIGSMYGIYANIWGIVY